MIYRLNTEPLPDDAPAICRYDQQLQWYSAREIRQVLRRHAFVAGAACTCTIVTKEHATSDAIASQQTEGVVA